jgi:hypothetical protein
MGRGMNGRGLREFALECLIAERGSSQPTEKDSFRVIAERLVRRANELDGVLPPATVARGPALGAPALITKEPVIPPKPISPRPDPDTTTGLAEVNGIDDDDSEAHPGNPNTQVCVVAD